MTSNFEPIKITRFSNELNRLQKLLVDTGDASTFEEASARLATFQLTINIGPDVATSRTLQAILLTAVNTGRRTFQGGVTVIGAIDVPLCLPRQSSRTLSEAVIQLGGKVNSATSPDTPHIVIGDVLPEPSVDSFAVRATFNGWTGGVFPLSSSQRLAEIQECEPAGVLAGALAVSEAFQYSMGNSMAGQRSAGISLWSPGTTWLDAELGPDLFYLPASCWLIGLGHLGQAYLWTLSLLPYADCSQVRLVLQDFDVLIPANLSTSMLTFSNDIGKYKTRAIAEWCDRQGFRSVITERHFTDDFRRQPHEPGLVLCGVDNWAARAKLEQVGFNVIVEAGLGSGADRYLNLQVHTFPGPVKAEDRWRQQPTPQPLDVKQLPKAYQELGTRGVDECGLIEIAGRAVGASFVGTVAATLVIGQVLRLLHDAPPSASISGTLCATEFFKAAPNNVFDKNTPIEFVTAI